MGFFPPVDPNAAYIDEDTGTSFKPPLRQTATPPAKKTGYKGNITGPVTDWLNRTFNPVHSDRYQTNKPSKPARTSKGDVVRMGDQEYSLNNPSDKAAYEQAQALELERQRKRGGGFSDIRGGDGRMPDSATGRSPDPRSPRPGGGGSGGTGRNDTRESPSGITQSGTNMTYDTFMRDIGKDAGVNVRNPFVSETLPGTPGYAATLSVTGGVPAASSKAAGKVNRVIEDTAASTEMVDGRAIPSTTVKAAEEGVKSSELESQRQLTPGDKAQTGLMDALASVKADPRFQMSARDRASVAFLNADDSMQGLRRAEGEMGLIAQGQKGGIGQKFVRDPSAEGGIREISKEAYRARMDGGDMQQAINDNPLAGAAKGKAGERLEVFKTNIDGGSAKPQQPTKGGTNAAYAMPAIAQDPPVVEDTGKGKLFTDAIQKRRR